MKNKQNIYELEGLTTHTHEPWSNHSLHRARKKGHLSSSTETLNLSKDSAAHFEFVSRVLK